MSSFGNVMGRALDVGRAMAQARVIWKPTKGSQEMFLMLGQLASLVIEVMFHGGRGIGKSEVLIIAYLIHVGQGWGSSWTGVIFKKEYKPLRNLIATSRKIIPRIFPDAVWNKSECSWTFATGEVLYFGHIKNMEDYENKYHGHEYAYVGWDELATWRNPDVYEAMMSTLRTAFIPTKQQPNMPPLQVRSTTNPFGVGKWWVYERFLEGKRPGEITYNKDGSRQPGCQRWAGHGDEGCAARQEHSDVNWLSHSQKRLENLRNEGRLLDPRAGRCAYVEVKHIRKGADDA